MCNTWGREAGAVKGRGGQEDGAAGMVQLPEAKRWRTDGDMVAAVK